MIRRWTALASCLFAASLAGQSNLLENGGAESRDKTEIRRDRGRQLWNLPEWTDPGGQWRAAESGWSRVDAHAGQAMLTCGKSDGGAISQDVDARDLPRTATHVALSAWTRSYRGDDENAIELEFLRGGVSLAARRSAWNKQAKWTAVRVFARVPKGTETIRVRLYARKKKGKWCDAFFDDVRVLACGKGLPTEFAKLKGKKLVDAWKTATADTRSSVELAMAFGDSRGWRALREAFDSSEDQSRRSELLDLLLASGNRDGVTWLRKFVKSRKNAAAMRLLAMRHLEILPDWPKLCARLVDEKEDERVRDAALDRLLRARDKRSLQAIARLAKPGDDALLRTMLTQLRDSEAPIDALYAPLLQPHLARHADSELREAAMQVLAARRDPRFLVHVRSFFAVEKNLGIRGRWIRALSKFDNVEAIELALSFVEDELDRADSSFFALLPAMRDDACLAWCAGKGLSHDLAVVRRASAIALAARPSHHVDALLAALARERDEEVQSELIRALATVRRADVVDRLSKLVADANPRASRTALRALAECAPDRAKKLATEMLDARGGSWQGRVAALETLGATVREKRGQIDTGIVERIRGAFRHSARQVRIAAYRALGEIRERSTIDALVARLDSEDPHTSLFILEVLRGLTGMDNGDPASWQRWWRLARDGFEIPPKAEKVTRQKVEGTEAASYYGIPLIGKSFVFIVDLSGSMKEKSGERTRLRAAQDELKTVLQKLPTGAEFNLVTFSTKPTAWKDELVRATADSLSDARRWIENLAAGGWTNVYDSLELALGMKNVETIFILTDGGPSIGKITDMRQIRDAVREINRDTMIRIHTIATGGSRRARTFLERLAEENWGEHSSKQ